MDEIWWLKYRKLILIYADMYDDTSAPIIEKYSHTD